MDLEKYRKLFLQECREHLKVLSDELLRFETEGESFSGVDAIFRAAHSVKGMSGSMGYEGMVSLSHALEDVFDGIRKKKISSSPELVTLLLDGVDLLGQLTDDVEDKENPDRPVEELVTRLRAAEDGARTDPEGGPDAAAPAGDDGVVDIEELTLDGSEEPPAAPPPAGGDSEFVTTEDRGKAAELLREGKRAFLCRATVNEDTASVTARNFVVLGKLNKAGTIIRSLPALSDVVEGRGDRMMQAIVATEKGAAGIKAVLESVPELEEITVEDLPPAPTAAPPAAGTLDGTGEPGKSEKPGKAPAAGPRDASRRLFEKYLTRKTTTVRVDTTVLDDLINVVGELIISRDRILESARDVENENLHTSVDRLNLLVRSFQDTIMAVRMMPLEVITDRLPRIVRDLARQGGKDIRFEITGQGIELDRAILEEMSDVLIHLVRNAIDHGIEEQGKRAAAGKPERAMVRLSAGRERDWVWVSVEDDGRGIDVDQVREKAVSRGLLDKARAAAMDRHDLLLLVCLPGLSTAEAVSDVSGRGVGMDVVKSRVESFGGSIHIDSEKGRGTRTVIRLPLTLAIVQTLLVDAGGHVFGIPVSHVSHTAKVPVGDVEIDRRQPVMRWDRQIVPLRTLAGLVGLGEGGTAGSGHLSVVITEQEGKLEGLIVDRLVGSFEAVIKPLGLPLKKVPGLAGATIVGNGQTVLVLDIKALL